MNLDNLITEAISNIKDRDQYGQRRTIDKQPNRLFKEPLLSEVTNHLESGKSEKYILSTYSGNAGIYTAICRK